jgi:hypothetical protein
MTPLEIKFHTRHSVAYLSLLCSLAIVPLEAASGDGDSYRYLLEDGKQARVCRHMQHVYNEKFRQPWSFQEPRTTTPPFPRLPGVEYDERKALDLLSSAFPTSAEFDAVQWKEGRIIRDANRNITTPMLVAEADIDNDGRQDLLVKISFMLSYSPAHRSVPGGNDRLFVLDKNQLALDQSATLMSFYGHIGHPRPALIDDKALDLGARAIRPFVYNGITYLSVYEQLADSKDKMNETMWVLRYFGGGGNLGGGNWEPARTDRICRFRMIVVR